MKAASQTQKPTVGTAAGILPTVKITCAPNRRTKGSPTLAEVADPLRGDVDTDQRRRHANSFFARDLMLAASAGEARQAEADQAAAEQAERRRLRYRRWWW